MMTIVGFGGDQEDDALALRDVPLRGVSPDDDEDDESLELVLDSSSEPDESDRRRRDPRLLPLLFLWCSLFGFSFFFLCLSADFSAFFPGSSQSTMMDHTSAASSSPICTCISSAGCPGVLRQFTLCLQIMFQGLGELLGPYGCPCALANGLSIFYSQGIVTHLLRFVRGLPQARSKKQIWQTDISWQ